ncbi:SCO1664 family protein [Streptomyces tubbatahanensis]|uniref:SCO1664 family protein n=2 Tax=Streptomyces tubbatahanensis TaxID=2923272 RepID=A0ABY3XNP6_9ACTN|nr:SCO1664 family protein [Streptomyces tubbatahanensis]UNS96086.1 SCO1664 family protein [Streptomyces tubbatahanensis]
MSTASRSVARPAAEATRRLIAQGTLTVHGQITEASNAVLFGTVEHEGIVLPCVYKPVAGERPLWDFPDGSLAQREVAAYEVSRATGWDLIPATVLRDGPYGTGMCQAWVGEPPDASETGSDQGGGEDAREEGAQPGGAQEDGTGENPAPLLALVDEQEPGEGWKAVGFADVGGGRTALLVHADDPALRRLAVLDAVINNGDRKGGHLLPRPDGALYAIDHGVTFHVDDKLRTLLWGWAGEELTGEAVEALRGLSRQLAAGAELAARLAELLTDAEVEAVRGRVEALLSSGAHPLPSGDWPAIPWPPV